MYPSVIKHGNWNFFENGAFNVHFNGGFSIATIDDKGIISMY